MVTFQNLELEFLKKTSINKITSSHKSVPPLIVSIQANINYYRICSENLKDGMGVVAFETPGDLPKTGENAALGHVKHDTSVTHDDALAQQTELDRVSGKENISQCDNIGPDLKPDPASAVSQPPVESNLDKTADATVKFRKKPGRKPGWRKHPAQDGRDTLADNMAKAAAKLRRKYRSTGDGLKRFGRRKRGRRGLRLKAAAPVVDGSDVILQAPITSTPTSARLDKTR